MSVPPKPKAPMWITRSPWDADSDAILYWSRCPDLRIDDIWHARFEGDVIAWQPIAEACLVLPTLPDDYRQVIRYAW